MSWSRGLSIVRRFCSWRGIYGHFALNDTSFARLYLQWQILSETYLPSTDSTSTVPGVMSLNEVNNTNKPTNKQTLFDKSAQKPKTENRECCGFQLYAFAC